MPALPHLHYTVKDYEQWPGDWELIEGHPIAMSPAPVIAHQLVITRIMTQLTNSLENCDACLAIADAEWHLDHDTVLRPDGVVICYPPKRYLDRPPVLAIEVISPSTAQVDEHYKFERYAMEGVQFYLMVWPEEKRAKLFYRNDQGLFTLKATLVESESVALSLTDTCRIKLDMGPVFKSLPEEDLPDERG